MFHPGYGPSIFLNKKMLKYNVDIFAAACSRIAKVDQFAFNCIWYCIAIVLKFGALYLRMTGFNITFFFGWIRSDWLIDEFHFTSKLKKSIRHIFCALSLVIFRYLFNHLCVYLIFYHLFLNTKDDFQSVLRSLSTLMFINILWRFSILF